METKKTYYDNGNIKEEYQVNKDGKPHGTSKLYHENGQLQVEVGWTDGIQNDGNIVSYHENGTKAKSVAFLDGYPQGEYKKYYNNGNIKEEFQVNKDGKSHGTCKLYHENGQLKAKLEFTDGIQNDGNIVSYHENGTKARSVTLMDGSFQGEFFQWHTNGVLSCQGVYKDGEVLERTLWDEDGSLKAFDNETIHEAVKKWLEDATKAEAKFGHISSWDTSGVTNMRRLFIYAEEFNDDIGNWDVSNVTNMSAMFSFRGSFNQDIGSWDVSNVTDMSNMFLGTNSFNQDISKWDVSNVLDMTSVFKGNNHMIEKYGQNGELLSKKDKTVNKSSENKTTMDINKDTIVSELGGVKTNIKLGFLLEIFCELYDIDYVDQIIQEINDEEESFVDEYFFIATSWEDENNLRCDCVSNEGYEELTKVLEKVFEEEFYYMRSDRYFWNVHAEVKDQVLKTFIKKQFVGSEICSSDGDEILSVTTKDHDYYDVTEINEKNFLTNDEKILDDSLVENDQAEAFLDAKYQYYYIRKKEFNIEKWWLGWTGEDD